MATNIFFVVAFTDQSLDGNPPLHADDGVFSKT
jgi:hypothetical protein